MAEHFGDGSLWRRAVLGTVIAELQGIDVVDAVPGCTNEIAESVCAAIEELPWFYRRPIKLLAFSAAMLSAVLVMRNLDTARPRSRGRVFAILRFVPGFGLFRKYVRALALLALFDAPGVNIPVTVRSVTE